MPSQQPNTIWTLNARDSLMLDVVRAYFGLSDGQMRAKVIGAVRSVTDALETKGVAYADLRTALTPQKDKTELALMFDVTKIKSRWYGRDVAMQVLPLLDRDLYCSLLSGDMVIKNQTRGLRLITAHVQGSKPLNIRTTDQLYCVYVNNLSALAAKALVTGLQAYRPFAGYIDTSTSSAMKDWLSTTLTMAYLKCGRFVINGHEDDAEPTGNYNRLGWPWEEAHFQLRSIADQYAHLLLAYKIERRTLPGETDTFHALTAISGTGSDLTDMPVLVEAAKGRFLRGAHGDSLANAGLSDLPDQGIAALIKDRIGQSYIYNLRYLEEHGTSLCNIMLEVQNATHSTPTRLVAALEFQARENTLRLVTLF